MQNKSTEKNQKIIGYLLRTGAVICFASMPISVKYYLEDIPGQHVTVISYVFSLLLCIPFLVYKVLQFQYNKSSTNCVQKSSSLFDIASYHWLFWVIIGFDTIMLIFYHLSIKYTPAATQQLFLTFAPVAALIGSLIFLRHKFPYLQEKKNIIKIFAAFFAGLIGMLFLTIQNNISTEINSSFLGYSLAFIMLLMDVLGTIAIVEYAKMKNSFSGIDFILRKILSIGIIAFVFSFPYLQENIFLFSSSQIYALLSVAIFYNFLGYWLAFEAFKRIDGLISYLMLSFSPIIVLSIEFLFFNTIITSTFFVGTILIMRGSMYAEYVNTKAEKKYNKPE